MIRSLFIVFMLLSFASVAFASPCEVYGISDSPQKLDCSFDKISLGLRCQNGTYYLDSSKVNTAFHYDVEEGPTPLVFKASDLQLTVTMYSRKTSARSLAVKEKISSASAVSKREFHPYGEFIPKKPRAMIIGSFPIGKFTNPERRGEIRFHEHDFFFGGEKNLLWKLLGEVFSMKIDSKENIIKLLNKYGLAVGDVIKSCYRKEQSASDADLYDIEWNENLLNVIHQYNIAKIYFTSKKVEQWFVRLFPETPELEKMTLISPSAQSVRALDRRDDFQRWFKQNPKTKRFEFILQDYKQKFETML